ncbi:MAG: DUF2844 domain-containing protein [Candidatus Sulfotelmatobacter sp.]
MLVTLLIAALPARAALGGDVASIQADQVHMQGTRQTTVAQSYTVHEIQAASGITVREYVSPAGQVFAVVWQGPFLPDLRQLLGKYFDEYVEGQRVQNVSRIGRRPLQIEQPGLVVQSGGHPRSFEGRAYIPELLPAGVGLDAIR